MGCLRAQALLELSAVVQLLNELKAEWVRVQAADRQCKQRLVEMRAAAKLAAEAADEEVSADECARAMEDREFHLTAGF